MNPERWKRVQAIFHTAVEQPDAAARESAARHLCRDDDALFAEVLALLRTADDEDAIERIVKSAPRPSTDTPLVGQTLGPYRVEDELGRGGMGTVYRGVRADDQYVKNVAIKVVRAGSDADLRRRFRSERQILATLDHPAIARLLDGGETKDGVPFLVMEYVEGVPIDEFCEARQLGLPDRIHLFRAVCDGVDYAHRHLIVHRDLKPSNILVDDEGHPRLLDFGIAKLLDPDVADGAPLRPGARTETVAHARRFTPEFASPEQVRGELVTTATDVYSLGVLLYGILAGRGPYEIPSTSPREMERIVCETDPALPSVASGRQELAGDLDNIVGKALRKEPAGRYGSVADLSADLRRHLQGLPVSARPDTWRYRATKFVRRNRATVAAVSLATVALVTAAVVSTTAFLRADRALAEAETQRDTVQQVNDFLRGMFEAADPVATQTKGGLTARDVLDAAAERIGAELGDRPVIAASLQTTIASSYDHIGEAERAKALLRDAEATYRATDKLGTAEGVRTLTRLGSVLRELDELEDAESVLREAVARAAGLPEDSLERPRAHSGLAATLSARGDRGEALPLFERALAELKSAGAAGEELVLSTRSEVALHHERRGEYPKAEENLRLVLEGTRKRLGPSHSHVGQVLSSLAFVLNRLERHEEAVDAARQSLKIHLQIFDDQHEQVAKSRLNLAEALDRSGSLPEAESEYRMALESFRAHYGNSHGNTAVVLGNFAMMYFGAKRYDEAIALIQEAQGVYERALGADHTWTLANRHNLGQALWSAGRHEESERVCRATLERRRATLDEDHLDIARSEMLLGRLTMERGESAEAESLLRDCLRISEKSLPADHSFRIEAEYLLGCCLVSARSFEEAEQHLVTAQEAYEKSLGPDAGPTQRAANQLVVLYENWGKPDRAEEFRAAGSAPVVLHEEPAGD